jgi:hypothetical protein
MATSPRQSAPATLAVRLVTGGSQQAFIGDTLASPVQVQVVDSSAHSIAGRRRLRVSIVSGGGSIPDTNITTNDDGAAFISWRLGAAAGSQELAVSIDDSPNIPTPIFAEALSPNDADLVIVHGATDRITGIVVRQDAYTWTYTLTWPDTILRLLPHAPANDGPVGTQSWQEVTAFAYDHPPATVLQPWTSGIDTVNLVLRPAVRVPFTVWIAGDYDTTVARAKWDLSNVDDVWRAHMTGLRVGAVTLAIAPEISAADCLTGRPRQRDPGSINIYYTTKPSDPPEGHTCDAWTVLVPPMTPYSFAPVSQFILAHSIGHALSLQHVTDQANVMSGNGIIGSAINTGQIYRMHFDASSSLNAVLHLQSAGARNCSLPFSAHCPDATFNAWY